MRHAGAHLAGFQGDVNVGLAEPRVDLINSHKPNIAPIVVVPPRVQIVGGRRSWGLNSHDSYIDSNEPGIPAKL